MQFRKRLKQDEAEYLGLKWKGRGNDGKNPRYHLDENEVEKLNDFRGTPYTQIISDYSKEIGVDEDDVKHGWLKTEDVSFFFTNPNYKAKQKTEFAEDLIKDIKKHAPIYPTVIRTKKKEKHLLVINPADVHIGKLCDSFEMGTDYDVEIAINRVKEGVNGILNYASGFEIDQIVFVGGNDILHIDTPKRTTTSGTPQDTDGMWYSNFRKAFELYVEVLEQLISIADVHFVYCPSNHDYTNGFFLCQAVEAYFHLNKNITFDCSISHRKYYKYGANLLGFTHGDGAKMQDLPLLMSHEAVNEWAETKYRYYYIHHIHHKMSKDYLSVCVESMRSPSEADSWHHRNGFEHVPKAIEGFVHHKEYGQISRLNYLF